ncbi:Glutamate receptor ionotropic, NMDA 3A [Frankliniella fusca]|uniref:Glutamate receptor ionotropic, NMDA 3A n=1 Tax=Frankliniella fusca TaxID=407009 RepID=A0AAE1LJ72_9NEOP|nr:Glutamate receptor ionotropic, NMDA 3A [Frankliniella fusca]
MDAMDQVGKALGAFGDTVHQAISDSINAGAEAAGAEGQRATGAGAGAGADQVGAKVGQVLASIGDTLHQVVSGGGGGQGLEVDGQRSGVAVGAGAQAAAEPGPDAPLGHILSSIGDKLRTAANGGEDGERALGQVGQQVGRVLATVGDTIRDVIRERQEGAEDDDGGEARLVSEPAAPVDKAPCMNSTMMAMGMGMGPPPGARRRGRGQRAAALRQS